MKTVLIFGTFDFLHSGHLYALKKAKKLGDTLIVSVTRDSVVKKIKGKAPIHSEKERLELVQNLYIVDKAFLGDSNLGRYSFFKKLKPDYVALGYDQYDLKSDIEKFIKKNGYISSIVILPTYNNGKTKSSNIKQTLGL